jgi:Rps23 Pro-64 3,4-dihydroxylase Tpa1-like proline 4-hydroxylase
MLGSFLTKHSQLKGGSKWERPSEVIEPFDRENLYRLAVIEGYATAQPFPHLIIDNLFNPRALDRVLSEWPPLETNSFDSYHDGTYTMFKYATNYMTQLGRCTELLLTRLAEPLFLEALQKVTGLSGLIPDPYLWGAGLHVTRSGGKLAIHADFIKHPKLNLDRRLNLILYLNRGWTEANEGCLELWNRNMEFCVRRILPIFNRTVVFSTTDFSFHGQPEPIQGPPDLFRKSITLFYYSNGRPDEEISGRDPSTPLWLERPGAGY